MPITARFQQSDMCTYIWTACVFPNISGAYKPPQHRRHHYSRDKTVPEDFFTVSESFPF